jgi:restriction system protein
VAYDTRPIFGGKVVIQAKRYKNTVGVSAVRDLFGTMQNEGATKGILVATSGYGQASHEFANGKPLELIDGANLLYLLRARQNRRQDRGTRRLGRSRAAAVVIAACSAGKPGPTVRHV